LCAVTGLVLLAYAPLYAAQAQALWARPHYQFFPFVWLGAALLIGARFPRGRALKPGAFVPTCVLLALSWGLLAVAEAIFSPWLGAVALLFLLLTVCYTLGGRALVRQLLPAWVLLWLSVPPPLGLDTALVLGLQGFTSRWSSSLLDLFGVYHVIAGNVVEIGNQRLFIEQACTGINSLFSILACTVFYVFWARIPVLRALALFLAAVFWILLANVARVFLVAYLARRWSINLAEGWEHDALGFVLFGVALGLIWSTDRLLVFLTPRRKNKALSPDPAVQEYEAPGAATLAARLSKSWMGSKTVAAAFAVLLVLHLGFYTWPGLTAVARASVAVVDLPESALPEDLRGWQRLKVSDDTRNPGSSFGEFSKTWIYRGDGYRPVLSLDYPFPEWHDLAICYKGQGWVLAGPGEHVPAGDEGKPAYYHLTFKKAGMRSGYLFYCEFDQAGQPVEADRGGTVMRQQSALRMCLSWIGQEPGALQAHQVGSVFQFQLFIESFAPLSSAELARAKEAFCQGFKSVRSRLLSKTPS
jgi:exosortase